MPNMMAYGINVIVFYNFLSVIFRYSYWGSEGKKGMFNMRTLNDVMKRVAKRLHAD